MNFNDIFDDDTNDIKQKIEYLNDNKYNCMFHKCKNKSYIKIDGRYYCNIHRQSISIKMDFGFFKYESVGFIQDLPDELRDIYEFIGSNTPQIHNFEWFDSNAGSNFTLSNIPIKSFNGNLLNNVENNYGEITMINQGIDENSILTMINIQEKTIRTFIYLNYTYYFLNYCNEKRLSLLRFDTIYDKDNIVDKINNKIIMLKRPIRGLTYTTHSKNKYDILYSNNGINWFDFTIDRITRLYDEKCKETTYTVLTIDSDSSINSCVKLMIPSNIINNIEYVFCDRIRIL